MDSKWILDRAIAIDGIDVQTKQLAKEKRMLMY